MTQLKPTELKLADALTQPYPDEDVMLSWLGQAGFVLRCGQVRLAIDLYLSDVLAQKYAGTIFDHQRMMPAPVDPAELTPLDAVLATHAHTDHLDPGTLPILAQVNPAARFIVPRSARAVATERGVPADRITEARVGCPICIGPNVQLHPLPSAHEQLATDSNGDHLFLGYVIATPTCRIYHSGDSVPYPGLIENLSKYDIDLAILPVNGRDEYRRSHGVPGNFTFDEAVDLCQAADIPAMVMCHFGMFAFNTIDESELDERIIDLATKLHVIRPLPKVVYRLPMKLLHSRKPDLAG